MTIYKDALNGVNIFKKHIILFLSISLFTAIFSSYIIPSLVAGGITEESINQELGNLGYEGIDILSPEQIIGSMVSSTQFLTISTVLFVIGYIVKYIIDKRLFDIKRWRDWKFFLYMPGFTFLEFYIVGSIFSVISNNFFGSIILMVIHSFFAVIISAILLPEELKPIIIQ